MKLLDKIRDDKLQNLTYTMLQTASQALFDNGFRIHIE